MPRATYSLRMSFWSVPASARDVGALPPGHGDVQRQQDDRRGVDGHRRRDAVERDAVEQHGHVLDRVDRHADAADLAGRQAVVRVVADLRRQIEGDAQARDALREQVAVARGSTPARCRSPAYCRIVHGRPRYIVGWMPRVNGNSPGSPMSVSGSSPAMSAGVRNEGELAIGRQPAAFPWFATACALRAAASASPR